MFRNVTMGENDQSATRKSEYRGGTSDATTPSSLIVSLIMMLLTTVYPETAIFAVRNEHGTDGRTDRRTRLLVEIRSRI